MRQTKFVMKIVQATTALVEKTVRAFCSTIAVISTIAVVCSNMNLISLQCHLKILTKKLSTRLPLI